MDVCTDVEMVYCMPYSTRYDTVD